MSELIHFDIDSEMRSLGEQRYRVLNFTVLDARYGVVDDVLKYRTTAFVGNDCSWGILPPKGLMKDIPTNDDELYVVDSEFWPSIFELLGMPVNSGVDKEDLEDLKETKFFQNFRAHLEIHNETGLDATVVATDLDFLDETTLTRNSSNIYSRCVTRLINDLLNDYGKFILSSSRSRAAFWKRITESNNFSIVIAPAENFLDASIIFLFKNGVFVSRLAYLYAFRAFLYVFIKILNSDKSPLLSKKGKVFPPFLDDALEDQLNIFFMPLLKQEYAKISELQQNMQKMSETLDEFLESPFAIYSDKTLALNKEGRIMAELCVRTLHLAKMMEMHLSILNQLMISKDFLAGVTESGHLNKILYSESVILEKMSCLGASLMQCNPQDFAALKSLFYDLVDTRNKIHCEINQAKLKYPEHLDTLERYATVQYYQFLQQFSECICSLVYSYRNILGFNLELFDILMHPSCPWHDYYKLLHNEWLKDTAASSKINLFEGGVSVNDHLVVVNVLSRIVSYMRMNYLLLNLVPQALSQTLSFNASCTNFSYHDIKCRICENDALPSYLRYGFLTFNPSLKQGVFLVGSEELKLYKQALNGISINFDALTDKHKELITSNPILAALTQRELPFKFNALQEISTSKFVWDRSLGVFNEQMSLLKTSSQTIPVYFDINNISFHYGYLLDNQRGLGFPLFIPDMANYTVLVESLDKERFFFENDQDCVFNYSYSNEYTSKWQKGWRQPRLDKESQTVVFRDLVFKLVKPMSMYDAIRIGIDQNTGEYVIIANSFMLDNKQRFTNLIENLRYADVSLRKQRCRFILQNCKSLLEQLKTKKANLQEQFKQLDEEQIGQLADLYLKNKKISILEEQMDKLEKLIQFMNERESKFAAENRKDEEESSSVAWQSIVDKTLELQTLILQGLEKLQSL